MEKLHIPVLLSEVLAGLQPMPGESYLDLTAGYGGHAEKILDVTQNYKDSILVDRDEFAVNYLKQKGYKILDRNFECRQGELDIIALDKKEIVFIEVKTRTSNKFGYPLEAVNKIKQKHMLQTIKYYLYIRNLNDEFVRIDVIEVYIRDNVYKVNHIKQALEG